MQQIQVMPALNRAFQATARAGRALNDSMNASSSRKHELLMKHGYPPPGDTGATFVRACAGVACAAILGATAVLITAMVVYQEHVIEAIKALQ